jgi:integrase
MKKRTYGTGYLFELGDKWYFQYRKNGKKIKRVLLNPDETPCQTKPEAEQAAMLLRSGIVPEKVRWARLEALDTAYLEANGQRMSKALKANRLIWMKRVVAAFPTVGEITHESLGRYIKARQSDGAGVPTVNRELSQLRRLLNWAALTGKIERSPMKGFRLVPEPNHRERILSRDEIDRLKTALEAFREHGNPFYRQARLIVLVALYTGMRYGEIVSLKWSDVDFNRGEFDLLKTKSGKRRKVPIPTAILQELECLEKGGEWVFPSRRAGLHIDDIRRPWGELLKAAEIEGFRFHDLRHTAASWMLRNGVDLNTVREILGHASIVTTQRYLTALEDQKRKAVEWME